MMMDRQWVAPRVTLISDEPALRANVLATIAATLPGVAATTASPDEEDGLLAGKADALVVDGGANVAGGLSVVRRARARGFDEVYHLKGGILAYLAEIEEADSLWRGDCFLFDERISITHGERQGEARALCPACGQPVPASAVHECTRSEGGE